MIPHDKVRILSGKYKGKEGVVSYKTAPHHLSQENRWQVHHQTGLGWITLLINESNIEVL